MFAVGVKRDLKVEEEMASTYEEEKSVDTHFYQRLVSVSLHSTF